MSNYVVLDKLCLTKKKRWDGGWSKYLRLKVCLIGVSKIKQLLQFLFTEYGICILSEDRKLHFLRSSLILMGRSIIKWINFHWELKLFHWISLFGVYHLQGLLGPSSHEWITTIVMLLKISNIFIWNNVL